MDNTAPSQPNKNPINMANLTSPKPSEFVTKVERARREYGLSNCIYHQSIEEIRMIKLNQLTDDHEIRIIRPFLLKWGVMGRVLGYAGVKRILDILVELSEEIEPFRSENLLSTNINETRNLIINLFNNIKDAKFCMSKKLVTILKLERQRSTAFVKR